MLRKIFADEHIIVIDKPAGLHSVRVSGSANPSVADMLISENPSQEHVASSPDDAGLIQRLDFSTSGIMIAAVTQEAWGKLRLASKEGRVEKEYYALVEGRFEGKKDVKTYLGSPYRRGSKVKVSETPKKRFVEASSRFESVRHFSDDVCTLVKACLSSGRRHQIRAQLSFFGHALVGDSLYGSKRSLAEISLLEPSPDRAPTEFFLHAAAVSFEHPENGRKLRFAAPIPDYLQKLRQFLE